MKHILCAVVALALIGTTRAQTPFSGATFGRATISDFLGVGTLTGPAQQSVTLNRNGSGVIISTMVAASTPVALGINDRMIIRGRRFTFITDFHPCGCEPTQSATGQVRVTRRSITYSANNSAVGIQIRGRITLRAGQLRREETRIQDGETFKLTYTLFR